MALDCFLRILLSSLFLTGLYIQIIVRGEPQVPCYFIFGDSLADPGNNNNLPTQAKSNYPPYGVDFPDGPTGRFTNNRTIPDVIGQLMGFGDNFIPPYLNLTGKDILRGVNYASGISGIRDETGSQVGDRVTMNEQLVHHLTIYLKIVGVLKSQAAAKQYLGRCIYVVITGNSDYINNYFMPNFYPTSRLYTPQRYADVLARQYSEQLKRLYSLGARKVAVFGVGLIGQTPEMVRRFGDNSSTVTATAQLFSNKLLPLVNDLNSQLSGAIFTYINTTGISITSAAALADLNTQDSCCPVQDDGMCVPRSTPCPDRARYAFFDRFHPTDVLNAGFAGRAYSEQLPLDASPYDIEDLVQMP